MIVIRYFLFTLLLLLVGGQAQAAELLRIQEVTDDVYAIVGEFGNRTPENLGNNATFGLVVTDEGAVLIDSGGTGDGAKAIDAMIKTVTDKPVVKVINTGGQDHRWMGNDYFKRQGADIIASEAAVEDQKARTQDQFFMLSNLVGERAVKSTSPAYAETTFADNLDFELGGIAFEIRHVGQAHTPGDSFIWLPQKKVMFSGDIVYIERMLGVREHSNSKSWVEVYEAMAAYKPEHLVPGHGPATDMAQADKDSYGYLLHLRQAVAAFMEDGGEIEDISQVDQSKYEYLLNFDTLAGSNAQQVFTEMEWE
uniref:SoxH protein, homolog n=1 Tax=uncultured Thiotrichaceae bacterium TaxID=298394 RepID=A0A6S6UCN4_9GAMM|nr:MAG: SoxH protein, homolog [uncultured Thiotrichaceae bacterium]